MAKSRAAVAGRDAIEVKHETLPANRVRLLDRTSALHSTGRPELRTMHPRADQTALQAPGQHETL